MRVTTLVLVAAAGCTHSAPAAGPRASEASIAEQSHTLLDAYFRGDAKVFEAMTDPTFVRFEGEKVFDRAGELAHMKPTPPPMTRAWKDERVIVRDRDATFIGMAVEHETGNDSHGNREYDGWYTMAWVKDGDAWKAVNWTWQAHKTAIDSKRDIWNDNFRQDIGFEHKPNHLLETAVDGVKAGTALDVETGQGRNAVFLATRGWTVTGIDISDEGLMRAREAAAAQHVSLDTVQVDADAYDFGVAKWDLVTLIYAPGSLDDRAPKIRKSLKPGGLLVVEFFLDQGQGGIKAGQLAKLFADGFEILRDEVVEDRPDWGNDKDKLVRFVARKRL